MTIHEESTHGLCSYHCRHFTGPSPIVRTRQGNARVERSRVPFACVSSYFTFALLISRTLYVPSKVSYSFTID